MIGTTAEFTRRLRQWYKKHRRDLPWRLPMGQSSETKLDPYHVMVSEAMLQQTQVATVIPYFRRFIGQFPTLADLAKADVQLVLRAWQGLGYYSRARNLQRSAQKILSQYGGQVPSSLQDLLTLPGVGRYTAGAISSIAFEKRSPILDGNVARVLCRLDAERDDPRKPEVREKLWQRAGEILPKSGIGDFNSALMELGAMICTPRGPQCLLCPVRANCRAYEQQLQDQIPRAKTAKKTLLYERWTFCIAHEDQYLVQQRPERGRWAGMWQFVTIESQKVSPDADFLERQFAVRATAPLLLGSVEHALTHRRYRFEVFTCRARSKNDGIWLSLEALQERPMPRPHLKIREMLAGNTRGGDAA
jgi:A/G-specific adenine glycosylase